MHDSISQPPTLSKTAAQQIRDLGAGERDLFTNDTSDEVSYAMSLRHFKAYLFASQLCSPQSQLLDLGCGSGAGAVFLSQQGHSVTAVDVDSELIHLLPTVWPASKINWKWYDGQILPLANNSCDIVTSFQVIEHVPDASLFLKEIFRVLKPKGCLVLTTPNRTLRVAPCQRPWNRYHIHEFWPWELKRSLYKAGFRGVDLMGLHGTHPLVKAERRRTIAAMTRPCKQAVKRAIKPIWLALPESSRNLLRRFYGTTNQNVPSASTQRKESPTPTEFSPNIFEWKKRGLLWSLDLLAVARKE